MQIHPTKAIHNPDKEVWEEGKEICRFSKISTQKFLSLLFKVVAQMPQLIGNVAEQSSLEACARSCLCVLAQKNVAFRLLNNLAK